MIFKIIDNFLIKNKSYKEKIKIVYRPHPWRMGKDKIFLADHKNIVIDPQVELAYLNNDFIDTKFQPDINYYTSLIKNSEFVVGGLTSMIIESSICYKNYIVSAFPEKQFNNQYNSLNYMVHFKELNLLNNVKISTNSNELEKHLSELFLKADLELDKNIIDKQRCFFLYDDNKDYSIRLLDLVDKLI